MQEPRRISCRWLLHRNRPHACRSRPRRFDKFLVKKKLRFQSWTFHCISMRRGKSFREKWGGDFFDGAPLVRLWRTNKLNWKTNGNQSPTVKSYPSLWRVSFLVHTHTCERSAGTVAHGQDDKTEFKFSESFEHLILIGSLDQILHQLHFSLGRVKEWGFGSKREQRVPTKTGLLWLIQPSFSMEFLSNFSVTMVEKYLIKVSAPMTWAKHLIVRLSQNDMSLGLAKTL